MSRDEKRENELARHDRCTGHCIRFGKKWNGLNGYILEQDARDAHGGVITGDIKHPDTTIGLLTLSAPLIKIKLELSSRDQLEELLNFSSAVEFDDFMKRLAEDAFDPKWEEPVENTCAEGCRCSDEWEYLETRGGPYEEFLALSFSHPQYQLLNIKVNVVIEYLEIFQKTNCEDERYG